MEAAVDIFHGLPDGLPVRVESVERLQDACARVTEPNSAGLASLFHRSRRQRNYGTGADHAVQWRVIPQLRFLAGARLCR